MGYIKHNAIIVTNWQKEQVESAREKAIEVFTRWLSNRIVSSESASSLVSPIITGIANSQYSFFIAPDGSKEGWDYSELSDKARKEFLDWLRDKSGNYCDYIEVRFGGDDSDVAIIRDKDSDNDRG